MRKLLLGFAVVGLFAGSACGGGDGDDGANSGSTNAPAAVSIKGEGTTWNPDEVTVKVGDVVEWDVTGSIVHDLKGDDGIERKAASNYKYTHTYDKPGTYTYECTIHPGMVGTVTVTA